MAEDQDPPAQDPAAAEPVSDADRDSLHTLPIRILPVEAEGLKKWTLTKSTRLDTVIRIFDNNRSGRGEIVIDEIRKYVSSDAATFSRDIRILRRVATLPSFDVYSLRIGLRRLDIKAEAAQHLRLSDEKRKELAHYMTEFTRPLVQKVYGGLERTPQAQDAGEIIRLFQSPDKTEALRNLETLSEKLGVTLDEIPKFLEEYGDIFLSLAYYRSLADHIQPKLVGPLNWLDQTIAIHPIRADGALMSLISNTAAEMRECRNAVSMLLDNCLEISKVFWQDINPTTFKRLRDQITRQHTDIGSLLCGLFIKTEGWHKILAGRDVGATIRADFIRTELAPGLNTPVKTARRADPLIVPDGPIPPG